MAVVRTTVRRWGGAILLMLVIYALSSRASTDLPNFGWADRAVKKGGHVLGYGLLALAYWHGFNWQPRRILHAWIMAAAYGVSDELHQTLVAGRHPSAVDVLLFDGVGAALALWTRWRVFRQPTLRR